MLIGLTGRAQAGKDTCFERLRWLYDGTPVGPYGPADSVKRHAFADPLYESAAAALGVTPDVLRRLKTDPSARVVLQFNAEKAYAGTVASITVREYLQRYGTEAHRGVFGSDFWVSAALDQLDLGDGRCHVFTDVRYENEATAIHQRGGVIVRVVGPPKVEDVPVTHASEAGVRTALIDMTVMNDRRDDFRTLDPQLQDVWRVAAAALRVTP